MPSLTLERDGFKLTGVEQAPSGFIAVNGAFFTRSPSVAYQCIEYARNGTESALRAAKKTSLASRSLEGFSTLRKHPRGFSYFPYQVAGIEFMKWKKRCLNADEPGTGKTIQIAGLINETDVKRVLVLCPASLRLNWIQELEKWVFRELEHVEIVSYDSAWRKRYFGKLMDSRFDMVVMDEAHYLKNEGSKRSKAALALSANVERVVLLTGTPVMNRPRDVYMLLKIVRPGMFPEFLPFATRYCQAYLQEISFWDSWAKKRRIKKIWNTDGASNLEELQDILRSTVMIRRLKSEVLPQLPKKIRQIVTVPIDKSKDIKEESEIWEKLCKEIGYEEALKRLTTGGSVMLEEMAKARQKIALTKASHVLDYVTNLLESIDKVVVFAHHRAVVDALMDGFSDYAPVRFVGGMSEKAKDASVRAFQNDPDTRVFVGNIQAAGVGITLTAASTVVFAELAFVPSLMSQAEDRCCRIGAVSDSVHVQHIVLDGSLDVHLAKMLVQKQDIADRLLDL